MAQSAMEWNGGKVMLINYSLGLMPHHEELVNELAESNLCNNYVLAKAESCEPSLRRTINEE
jgi:hypothetical protein